MADLIHQPPSGPKEGPSQDDFIFIGGIEMTVADFVAIWNGEDILPQLSPRDVNTERRKREPSPYVHDDPWNDAIEFGWLFRLSRKRGLTEREERRIRESKLRAIKRLIGRYHSEAQPIAILDMDRVLAVLATGQVRFNDVTQFIARYAEPHADETLVVREAAHESHSIDVATHIESRYVSEESAAPLATLPPNAVKALQEYLGINEKGLELIPVIILERILAGHELTDDDLRELSNIRNIGSHKLIYVLQKTREALFGLGILATSAMPVFARSHPELANALLYGGLGTSTVAAVSHFIPLSSFKPRVKLASSIKRYRALEDGLRSRLGQLCESPTGRVQALLLQQMIRGTYELNAQQNVPALQAFVDELSGNQQRKEQFDAMCSSIDRPLDTVTGVLQAIEDFRAVQIELPHPISVPRLPEAKK